MIDFSVDPPNITRFDLQIRFRTTASISDKNGNLLAYTNGCQVMNKHHMLAQNGDSINPGRIHDLYCDFGYPLGQGAVFLPIDTFDHSFRLMHLWEDDAAAISALLFSEIYVDIAGLALVTKKNVIVDSVHFSKDISAVKHANGRDWWIVLCRYESNIYDKYLSTPYGVVDMGSQTIGEAWDHRDWSGQVAFAPNGEWYARICPFNNLYLFRFDRCSGELYGQEIVDFPGDTTISSGVAFSSDSRYLYISQTTRAYQFDLTAKDIPESRVAIAQYDGFVSTYGLPTYFYQEMLAPNGKIYLSSVNTVRHLHVIEEPTKAGVLCQFEQHAQEIPTLHGFSTPNFPNYRLGPIDYSVCDSLGLDNIPRAKWRYTLESALPWSVRFTDLSYYEPDSWHWDFGDGTSELDQYPSHTYTHSGQYQVCLTVSNEFGIDTQCDTIEIESSSSVFNAYQSSPTIYPNPFRDNVTIETDDLCKNAEFRLYNVLGICVRVCKIEDSSAVYFGDLTDGQYFYSLICDDTVISTGKLVKY